MTDGGGVDEGNAAGEGPPSPLPADGLDESRLLAVLAAVRGDFEAALQRPARPA